MVAHNLLSVTRRSICKAGQVLIGIGPAGSCGFWRGARPVILGTEPCAVDDAREHPDRAPNGIICARSRQMIGTPVRRVESVADLADDDLHRQLGVAGSPC
jgi:hypothetical protein